MRQTAATKPSQTIVETPRERPRRHNWFILGLIALLLVVATGAVGWWIGSSGDDDAPLGARAMPEVLEDLYHALIEGDSRALAALFTDDGGFTGPQEEQVRSDLSPPSMIQLMVGYWFQFVDYTEVEHLEVVADANTVVVVSRMDGMSATHQRSSETPFSTTVVDVFELRDGQIAQWDSYFEYGQLAT